MTAPALPRPRPTAEQIRVKIGFSHVQWTALIESGYSPYVLVEYYDRFVQELERNLDLEFSRPAFELNGERYLSTRGVSAALGIGEFLIANLRARGKLVSSVKVGRRCLFSREDLMAFIANPTAGRSSPLANVFIHWMRGEDPENFLMPESA